MAGIGLGLLAKLKGKRGEQQAEYEWGSATALQSANLDTLTRAALRKHLDARDLDPDGTKKVMVERLRGSLDGERLQSIAYTEQLEAEFAINKDIEERGAVYSIGANPSGQLGLGDAEPRNVFTPVHKTRGLGVIALACNADLVFAVTADHEVLVWGGAGTGATGIAYTGNKRSREMFAEPQYVDALAGEEVCSVCVGASHSCAVSRGGDVFVWGHNLCGQLGLTHYEKRAEPQLLTYFEQDATLAVTQAQAGENHCAALTREGHVYCWGHVASGRLGLGVDERYGAKASERLYFPSPTLLSGLTSEPIRQIACGAEHTLALANARVFAWGHGAGGRLGVGDCVDRVEPYSIPLLENLCVLSVAAATWDSAALVLIPPLLSTGWVYTWGSGYHGQLGHGRTQVQMTPAVVQSLVDRQLSAKSIRLGSHHSAMIALDGELYTWGSNLEHCLGHDIQDKYVEHTAEPGHVSGFGAIVERVGRGMVRDYVLGRECTIVATYPYEGPSEDVARKLMEEEAIRLDMLTLERDADNAAQGDKSDKPDTPDQDEKDSPRATSGGGDGSGGKIATMLDKGMTSQKTRN